VLPAAVGDVSKKEIPIFLDYESNQNHNFSAYLFSHGLLVDMFQSGYCTGHSDAWWAGGSLCSPDRPSLLRTFHGIFYSLVKGKKTCRGKWLAIYTVCGILFNPLEPGCIFGAFFGTNRVKKYSDKRSKWQQWS
jgi:hypothetical protein